MYGIPDFIDPLWAAAHLVAREANVTNDDAQSSIVDTARLMRIPIGEVVSYVLTTRHVPPAPAARPTP